MTNLTSISQTVTLAASTQQTMTWSQYFRTIAVKNSASVAVYVSTDGATAATVGGAGCEMVPAGQVGVEPYAQARTVPVGTRFDVGFRHLVRNQQRDGRAQ